MIYKAIMLDLDDTTVVHGKENLPSDRVTQAIVKAQEKIRVCIATARLLEDTQAIIKHLNFSGLCILMNGTQIYDPIRQRVVYEKELDQVLALQVLEICRTMHLRTFVHDGNEESEYDGGPVSKKVIAIYIAEIPPSHVDDIVTVFQAVPNINVQKLPSWDKKYMGIHITHPLATKLHGIVEVSRMLGLAPSEIIGVGDGYNDFALLSACGLKIAMGNAVPEIKAIADFIAPSVYDDGVATVIEKFVLAS